MAFSIVTGILGASLLIWHYEASNYKKELLRLHEENVDLRNMAEQNIKLQFNSTRNDDSDADYTECLAWVGPVPTCPVYRSFNQTKAN